MVLKKLRHNWNLVYHCVSLRCMFVTGQVSSGVTGGVSQSQLLWGSHQRLTPFFVPRSRLPKCLFFFYKMGKNDLIFQIGRLRQKEALNKSSKIQNKYMPVPRREFLVPCAPLFSGFPPICLGYWAWSKLNKSTSLCDLNPAAPRGTCCRREPVGVDVVLRSPSLPSRPWPGGACCPAT